ncbi:MAG: hypothetical protein ACRDL5_14035 [Solirubrobacteraceae bacterium]
MTRALRQTLADWLLALGAPLLLLSLFLTWSHQFSPAFLARFGHSSVLQGVPRDPTAWQVYSDTDVMLALIAGGMLAIALWGGHARRLALALAVAVAIAFTVHAIAVPPTNGAVVFDPGTGAWARNGASSGAGEWLALVALAIGAAGIGFSFSAER